MKLNSRAPFYLLLLPVFFSLHVLAEHFVPALIDEAVQLILIYGGISIIMAAVAWLLLRDLRKAALVAVAIMAFNLFFGSAHDFIRQHFSGLFFSRYSFILPFAFVVVVVLVIYLKKTKKTFVNTTRFLNLLFLVLIAIDLVVLAPKLFENRKDDVSRIKNDFIACDTCTRPDVYLIITDEYAGKTELRDLFSFDNSAFENELRARGFYIVDSSEANYNATVYSMASMLSMDYIKNLEHGFVNHRDMMICRGFIQYNNIIDFFKSRKYAFFNHSYFELGNKKKAVYNPFYPTRKALFTAQTFTSRFRRNLGFNFASKEQIEKLIRHHLYNNKTIDSLARLTALSKDTVPKFVYTHLAMPHHPYYFDSTGKPYPTEMLTDSFTMKKEAYIEYLLYSNKKLLSLVDHIRAHSARPPVIILISDHGFRQLPADVPHRYHFMNLNAVYLPGGNYAGFYKGMSNVNEFRLILNNQFGQRLPLLKDSTSYLNEPHVDF